MVLTTVLVWRGLLPPRLWPAARCPHNGGPKSCQVDNTSQRPPPPPQRRRVEQRAALERPRAPSRMKYAATSMQKSVGRRHQVRRDAQGVDRDRRRQDGAVRCVRCRQSREDGLARPCRGCGVVGWADPREVMARARDQTGQGPKSPICGQRLWPHMATGLKPLSPEWPRCPAQGGQGAEPKSPRSATVSAQGARP